MLIDGIFKFLEVIKQTFCIHQYKGKAKGAFGTRIYYQCVKCGRIIQHKPPKQLMYKELEKMTKIYEFQSNNMGGYNFMVLANSPEEAWKLIKDRIASNKNQFLDDEFVSDKRNYSITEIELDGSKVLEDWENIK